MKPAPAPAATRPVPVPSQQRGCGRWPENPLRGSWRRAGREPDEIKRVYRALAKEWHPDRNHKPEASARFKEINAAYDCLKDTRRRASYDHMLKREQEWTRESAKSEAPKAKPAGAEASAKKASPKEPPRAKRRARGGRPPYPMFACALAALLGWWWFVPPQGAEEAQASAPTQSAAPPAKQPAPAGEPAETVTTTASLREDELRRAERDRTEITALQAEIERLRTELARRAEAEVTASSKAQSEREAQQAEIGRLQAELRRRDEIQQTAGQRDRLEKDRVRAEKMARWAALTERLFGAPFQDGLPCEMPVLRGQRCYDVNVGFPDALSFKFGKGPSQQFEVNSPFRNGRSPATDGAASIRTHSRIPAGTNGS